MFAKSVADRFAWTKKVFNVLTNTIKNSVIGSQRSIAAKFNGSLFSGLSNKDYDLEIKEVPIRDRHRVRQNLLDSGIPLRGTVAPKPVTYRKVADKMLQIERLLSDGMTIGAIAKQLGLNPKTVSKVKKSLSSI